MADNDNEEEEEDDEGLQEIVRRLSHSVSVMPASPTPSKAVAGESKTKGRDAQTIRGTSSAERASSRPTGGTRASRSRRVTESYSFKDELASSGDEREKRSIASDSDDNDDNRADLWNTPPLRPTAARSGKKKSSGPVAGQIGVPTTATKTSSKQTRPPAPTELTAAAASASSQRRPLNVHQGERSSRAEKDTRGQSTSSGKSVTFSNKERAPSSIQQLVESFDFSDYSDD